MELCCTVQVDQNSIQENEVRKTYDHPNRGIIGSIVVTSSGHFGYMEWTLNGECVETLTISAEDSFLCSWKACSGEALYKVLEMLLTQTIVIT